MSANSPDAGISRDHARIAPPELQHHNAQLRLIPILTNRITSNRIPLFCCSTRPEWESMCVASRIDGSP